VSDREARESREAEYGYQESSLREVRFREWWSSRDDPRKDLAFQRMVESLRYRRWYLKIRAEGGARYERLKARQRALAAAVTNPRRRAERADELRSMVIVCPCGAAWCPVPGAPGRLTKWCSQSCKMRYLKRPTRKWVSGGVIACRTCGVEYCAAPWAKGRQPKCCSTACRRADESAGKRRRRGG
jgi:hypothetical protein